MKPIFFWQYTKLTDLATLFTINFIYNIFYLLIIKRRYNWKVYSGTFVTIKFSRLFWKFQFHSRLLEIFSVHSENNISKMHVMLWCPCLYYDVPVYVMMSLFILWCPCLCYDVPVYIMMSLFILWCPCSYYDVPVYIMMSLFILWCPCLYYDVPVYIMMSLFIWPITDDNLNVHILFSFN